MNDTLDKMGLWAKSCFTVESSLSNKPIPLKTYLNSPMIAVDISEDEFEVPTFLLKVFYDLSDATDKIVCVLASTEVPINKSTATSILSTLGGATLYDRLRQIITNKGETYYGCKGLILDCNFNPLFLTTACFKKIKNTLTVTGIKVHVARDIFARQGEIIPNTIIKKLIPTYCTLSGIDLRVGRHVYLENAKPEVVIGFMNNMILSRVLPSVSTANDAHFNELLCLHTANIKSLAYDL